MSARNSGEHIPGQRQSRSAMVVLGMHRSGTSVLTGALRLSGAWVGEDAELTGRSVENPYGFWERRDIRQICDRLLHAAGADWWKVASFDTVAIPHAVLADQRRRFEKVITELDRHDAWVIKEPRLCLLLPVLLDFLADPVCIHVVRNPLEVARSLQTRNGFSIPAGIALWEMYNRRALSASSNVSRIFVSHESLMLRPAETTGALLTELADSYGIELTGTDIGHITRFINPSLYRRRATEDETREFLTSSQCALWQHFHSEQVGNHAGGEPLSSVTRQHLYDLESTQMSLIHYKDVGNDLNEKTIELNAVLKQSNARIEDLRRRIHDLDHKNREMGITLTRHVATIQKHTATIRDRERKIRNIHDSTSWKVTAPLRFLSVQCRRIATGSRRAVTFVWWVGTGQFPKATRAAVPYYEKYAPRMVDRCIPGSVREYARLAMSVPDESSQDGTDEVSPSRLRKRIEDAEMAFMRSEFPIALDRWKELKSQFSNDEAVAGRAKLEISITDRLLNLDMYRSRIRDYMASRKGRPARETRVVVYTAIVRGYDSLKLPDFLNSNFDYILFSDSRVPDTGIWEVHPISYFGSDSTRTARFVKTHPHLLLSDYDVAIWIDSNIMILDDISDLVSGFLSSGKAVGCVPHPSRTSIYEEFAICRNKGKDESEVMKMQMDDYRRKHFSHDDLIESNFMMFNLNHGRTDEFLNVWWREIDAYSMRDQLSINYSLSRVSEDWHRLTDRPHSIRNHDKFAFVPHDGGNGSSVRLVEALEAAMVDPYDGPAYAEIKDARTMCNAHRTVDIIICVHNALDYVRRCLESVRSARTNPRHRLIIVDDGSSLDTAEYLRDFAAEIPNARCFETPKPGAIRRRLTGGCRSRRRRS